MTTMITGEMLVEACDEQREVFVQEWPEGAEATLKNVLRAVELGLDLVWGTRWFTPEALDEFLGKRAPLLEAYERQIALILEAYERQIAPLREAYQRQITAIWEAYERQLAPLWLDYQRQIAPIWLEAFLASRGEK